VFDDDKELSDELFADAHAASPVEDQNPSDLDDVSRHDHNDWNSMDDNCKTLPEIDVESGELGTEECYDSPDDLASTGQPSSDESLVFVSNSAYGDKSHLDLSPDLRRPGLAAWRRQKSMRSRVTHRT
jgi:hypothetical protein